VDTRARFYLIRKGSCNYEIQSASGVVYAKARFMETWHAKKWADVWCSSWYSYVMEYAEGV
jgi:hypothetical protein